ncbi:extracellular solute-binding protein [Anaerocolumna xylanovorans]|uniref:Putative aldouronate transport system substrate-binding protein n=1 Tax=Anaerocolumna xylanovorans DSM 12503 TaxID=1121345 RepID=A0A1M7XYB8_9FIRM|nr:extracellular solute-binding protein [Anaerocolumna xylanovorans]SHO43804.1 putative aldouronate transport system substrate-binding protein [Anaerocolumna xylanovorans DSM 12503]
MLLSKRFRRVLGVLCVAAMAIGSLAACGSKTPSGNGNTSNGAEGAAAEEVTFPLTESYKFSIMTRVASDSEQDFSKKALVQRMQEATNVTADYQAIPDEQFNDKFKLALSKKDMPDVVTKMYIKPYDILGYANKGVFIPLESYIDKNMPNFKKILDARPEVRAAITSADGHIYTLPFVNEWSKNSKENINVIGAIPYINKSWLDKLGLEMPTTTDELKTVLEAFAKDIKDENGNVIPMSFRINQVNQDPGISLGSFGSGDNMDHYMVTNDKKVFYSLAQDDARKGLEWLHELYAQGLIDPEIFSQDASTYSAKVSTGRVGLFYDWAIGLAGDYTDEYVALPPLSGPDGTVNIPRQNYYSFDMGVTAVTSACKKPSVVLAYLDQYFEPSMSVQNCNGTYDDPNYTNVFTKGEDGMLKWTKEGLEDNKVRNDQNLADCFAILSDYYGVYVDKMLDSDALRLNLLSTVYSPFITSNYNYPAAFMEQADITRIAEIETDLKTYAEQTKAGIVKDGITDEAWKAYLTKLDEMGLKELIELKQKGFDMFYELTN